MCNSGDDGILEPRNDKHKNDKEETNKEAASCVTVSIYDSVFDDVEIENEEDQQQFLSSLEGVSRWNAEDISYRTTRTSMDNNKNKNDYTNNVIFTDLNNVNYRSNSDNNSDSDNSTCNNSHADIVTSVLDTLSAFDDDEIEQQQQYSSTLAAVSRWNAEGINKDYISHNSSSPSLSQLVSLLLKVSPDRPPKRPIRRSDKATLIATASNISL